MKKLLLNSLAVLLMANGWAQSPLYIAELPAVKEEGFYRIVLTPEIIAGSVAGFQDIRIHDNNRNPVPYVLRTENPVSVTQQFIDFPVVSVKKGVDQLTHVTLRNDSNMNVQELLLYVTNTVANRNISVSGSNDSSQWFIIKENVPVEGYFHEKDLFIQSVDLPLTAYKYYEIIINGKNLLPINITRAGVKREHFGDGNFQQLPAPAITQQNRNKITYAAINFKNQYQVDQLVLKITKPKFFKREINVFNDHQLLGSFAISSGAPVILPVRIKSNKLRLEINNQDNPAIIIDSIQAFQLTRSLIAYLDKGECYQLSFGDSSAKAPNYDLAAFADSVGKSINELHPGVIEKINAPEIIKDDKSNNKLILWIATGIILIILLIITLKMAKEVNKREK
jgi:hypothetical protein